uniref:Synapse defective Rho GTPase homolog 1 n=1 Tax=Haplochromis burtoni TaxID=8153 RepID=A0A3Q2VIK1_HAPBU
MAEPLLKRTFSRLRGRDRSRRKTDPKLSEAPVRPDNVFQSSSSPSSPTLTDPDPPSPPRNHITVAKKQQWARQGSAAPPTFLTSSSTITLSDQERPTGISQDASGQALSHRLVQDKATLLLLLDHLSLVASLSAANRMTHQNLAVCFGPVLLTPTQDAWRGGGGKSGRGSTKGFYHGEEMASAVDFKRHIEALHYLLQLWPVPTHRAPADANASPPPSSTPHQNPLVQQQRHPALRLALPQSPEEEVVVSRRGRGGVARLESPPPINRYAGDWSVCGQEFLTGQDADYDEVAGSESDAGSDDEDEEEKKRAWPTGGGGALYMDDFLDFDAPFNCRLSLKDFDTLIHDLDRELAKQICL